MITHSPSLSPSLATPGLRMLYWFVQNRGVFMLPTSTDTENSHIRVCACCCFPLAQRENGTVLPVSQLVAMATHPTQLTLIPLCFLQAGNGVIKRSYLKTTWRMKKKTGKGRKSMITQTHTYTNNVLQRKHICKDCCTLQKNILHL